MNPTPKSDNTHSSTVAAAIPDPWYLAAQSAEPLIPPAWQFPLDPHHELPAHPSLEAIAGAGPGGAALLTVGKFSEARALSFLIEEELKLPARLGDQLRDGIRDAIACLELAEAAS